jgi:hypothetical protein
VDHLKSWREWGPVAYKLALPPTVRAHNVFHVSLLKKYVHDSNHVIDWTVIQVEPEGEFHPKPQCILDKRETMLWNRAMCAGQGAMEALWSR